MTGAEHYRKAEQLLDELRHVERAAAGEPGILAEAHVHATLALAAGYAMANAGEMTVPDHDAWHEAASAAGSVYRIGGTA